MLLPLTCCTAKMPSGPIRAYEYTKRNCSIYPVFRYQLVVDASGVQTLNYSIDEDEVHCVVLQEDALGKIDAIVRKYKLFRLKRDYKPPFTVYDGWAWSMTVSYERDSIHSGGTNARPPRRMKEGIDLINEYIKGFIPASE